MSVSTVNAGYSGFTIVDPLSAKARPEGSPAEEATESGAERAAEAVEPGAGDAAKGGRGAVVDTRV